MKLKFIKRLEIINMFFIGFLGTLFHFVYKWSGENKIIALFAPVNESIFEHLKLLFFPWLFFLVFELILFKEKQIIPSKFLGIFIGMLSVIVLFYTYSGVLGYFVDFINILIFFIAVAIQYIVTVLLLKNNKLNSRFSIVFALIMIVVFMIMFFVFTFYPPQIALFKDPSTYTYGIK